MTPTLIVLTTMTAAGMPDDTVEFEKLLEITAGGRTFRDTLYPSPALYDLNGDGQNELIVGDLGGYLWKASRESGDISSGWGWAANIKTRDGQKLKFNNW